MVGAIDVNYFLMETSENKPRLPRRKPHKIAPQQRPSLINKPFLNLLKWNWKLFNVQSIASAF